MRKLLLLVIIFSVVGMVSASDLKTRLIVMSDIGGADPDDKQSFVHLLTCLDRIDLEGFIFQYAWVGIKQDRENGVKTVNEALDVYKRVLPNLRCHSTEFPDDGKLRKLVKHGQAEAAMSGVGEEKDSEGSEWIISIVDSDDSRPVWIASWSGMNTLAQALWKVKHTRNDKEVARFVSKLRVYDILGQDDAGAWITTEFPQITYIRNTAVYGWPPSDEWLDKHIQAVGYLGAQYPDRIWATEGDSPSFLYVINNGLNFPEHLDWGGWGGRFSSERTANIRSMDWVVKSGLDETKYGVYYMHGTSSNGSREISRWSDDIYNDFAARMLWTATDSYSKANHHPIIYIGKNNSTDIVNIKAKIGKRLMIDASHTKDPDGDNIYFQWMSDREAGTYDGNLSLDSIGSKLSFQIPNDAAGKNIHIILRVTDDGMPSLASYRRIVVTCEH